MHSRLCNLGLTPGLDKVHRVCGTNFASVVEWTGAGGVFSSPLAHKRFRSKLESVPGSLALIISAAPAPPLLTIPNRLRYVESA